LILCDDGPDPDIIESPRSIRSDNCPDVNHVWHARQGFRPSRARNGGIALASSGYWAQVAPGVVCRP
ncbi:MAG: hypothetical protein ABSB15_26210, partial [Bryobacteraceae bacterium]